MEFAIGFVLGAVAGWRFGPRLEAWIRSVVK